VRKSSAETLLAQFTSRDNAVSIVGDITESSLNRPRGWFTGEVIRLAVWFWIRSVLAAPGRALGYAGVGLAMYFGAYAISFIASGLPWFPWHRTHEWGFSLRLWAVVFVSNLLTGAILAIRLSPGRTHAIAWLMLLWVTAALIWPLFALRLYPWSWWPSAIFMPWRFVLAVSLPPLLYVTPLVLGVVASRKLFGAANAWRDAATRKGK
jgi:hypothetical protein